MNLRKYLNLFGPAKVVLSLDIIDDELVIRGRRTKTGINYKDFVIKMAEMGVERFIVTDVLTKWSSRLDQMFSFVRKLQKYLIRKSQFPVELEIKMS